MYVIHVKLVIKLIILIILVFYVIFHFVLHARQLIIVHNVVKAILYQCMLANVLRVMLVTVFHVLITINVAYVQVDIN